MSVVLTGTYIPPKPFVWWMLSLIVERMLNLYIYRKDAIPMMGCLLGILNKNCVHILRSICWEILNLQVFMILKLMNMVE